MEHDLSGILPKDVERLDKIKGAMYCAKRLFKSDAEKNAYDVAREISRETRNPDFIVMAQVSMPELFKAHKPGYRGQEDEEAGRIMSALRCDLAIFNPQGSLRLIIEVHGEGHLKDEYSEEKRSAIRANDELKRYVCSSANRKILEIGQNDLASDIRKKIIGSLRGVQPRERQQALVKCPLQSVEGFGEFGSLESLKMLLAAGYKPEVA